MKTYTWHTSPDGEWNNDIELTIDECIEQAQEYGIDNDTIFVGEVKDYVPHGNIYGLLESMEEDAFECVGDAGYDWNGCNWKEKEQMAELKRKVHEVIWEWQKKYGYYPNELYEIENIREVKI